MNEGQPSFGTRKMPQIDASISVVEIDFIFKANKFRMKRADIQNSYAFAQCDPRNDTVEHAVIADIEHDGFGTFDPGRVQLRLRALEADQKSTS